MSRHWEASWRRRGVIVGVVAACVLAGCNRRPGLNFDCAWVADAGFAADLQDEAHVTHLLDDIRAAEELDIRHRDRLAGYRLVDSFGIVSRHGRDPSFQRADVDREAQRECLVTLFGEIASTHGVTVSDIEHLRPRLAARGTDLPVTLPLVALWACALAPFVRWLGRFDRDEWLAWIVASLAGAVLLPTVVLGVGWPWAMVVEVVRLGNEHVGYRARTGSLLANYLVLFLAGVVVTWLSALARRLSSIPSHG